MGASFKLSEVDFLQYLDLTPDGVVAIRGGQMIFANQAFARMMRASSPGTFIGRPLLGIVAPEDAEKVKKWMQEKDPRAIRSRADIHCICVDGAPITFELAGRRVGDRDNPLSLLVVRDVTEVRARVEQLRRAYEERGQMFEGGPIGVTLTDTEGRYLHANSAMCELIGYTVEELRSRTYLELTHPADRLREVQALRALWTGTPEATIHKRFLRRDGEVLDVSSHITLLRDAEGDPRGYVSHIVDNTAELKAAAALRRAEAQLRTLFSGAQIGLGVCPFGEGKGYFQRVNPALCQLFGYSEQEMLMHPLSHFTDPIDSANNIDQMDPTLLRPGEKYKAQKRYIASGGRKFLGERFVSIIPDAQGKAGAAVLQIVDVTAQSEAERGLAESEGKHRMLMQNMPKVAILVFDREFRYTQAEAGEMLRDLLAFNPRDLVGKTVGEVADPVAVERVMTIHLRALEGETIRWLHERGGRIFDCHTTPMRDERGEIVGGITVLYDTPVGPP